MMYSFLLLLVFIGTFLFYSASEKVKAENKPEWANRLAKKPMLARAIGSSIFLLCWGAAIYLHGLGAGCFAIVTYIMACCSLLVLLAPMHYLNASRVAILVSLMLFLEIFIF